MTDSRVPGRGAAVHCRRVTHLYQREAEQVVALRDVDLDVTPGETIALLGPSGSGKSTMLSLLAGLQTPTTGDVTVAGHNLARANRELTRRLRADTVGLLLQDPGRTLLPYVRPPQLLRAAGDPNPPSTLNRYGLHSTTRQHVGTLSAGQQQRLALAVTMARQPALLLADEPTSRLDAQARTDVLAALHEAARDAGTTVIVVTHDPAVAASFPRTITMRDGRVGSEGRHGEEYTVVAEDGTIALSPTAMGLFPPGSQLQIKVVDDMLQIHGAPRPPAPDQQRR
jgi:ABC-type lipoprotein export system ATPase subunit